MKIADQIKKICLLMAVVAVSLTACNKLELDPTPNVPPNQETTPTLANLLDAPEFSLLKSIITKAGLIPTLSVPTLRFTLFAPDNDAIDASLAPLLPPGATSEMYIASVLDAETAKAISQYHLIPQEIPAASIPTTFPNFQYPTLLNPAPSVSALLRLTTFPSVRSNGAWVNNVPIIATNIEAVNGVMHKVARLVSPPSKPLWARIATDPELTYLTAAIQRADSGTTATVGTLNPNNLQSVLTEFGPNLTVFAPTDVAMQALLYAKAYPPVYSQLYAGAYANAIAGGATAAQADGIATAYASANAGPTTTALISSPTVFQNPAFFGPLDAKTVKGLLVYHILGSRAFSVNLPITATYKPTLLNSVFPTHQGVSIVATFTGPSVTAATIKGVGNATAANIAINPTPNPNGTSDQHFINGVLHKIDQVLIPQ
jgi:uncharacterized surface protein with fasciclin (FAS1) repeats